MRCPSAAGGAAGEAGVEMSSGVSSAMQTAVLLQIWTSSKRALLGPVRSGRDEMDKGTERGSDRVSGHTGCAVRRCGVYSSARAGREALVALRAAFARPALALSERGVCAGT